MIEQKQWMSNWIHMTRNSIEAGTRTLENLSQQTERAMELTINSANIVQGETRKLYDSWLDNMKTARKMYTDVVQSSLDSLGTQFKAEPGK